MWMDILETVAATLLVINKWRVYKEKPNGWIYGIWGTVAITIYFYLQMVYEHKYNLWIMIIYDIALLFLMGYAYLVRSSEDNAQRKTFLEQWDFEVKTGVALVTITTCAFISFQMLHAQLIMPQFLSVIGGLVGTVLLALKGKLFKTTGWTFYFFTHLIVIYLTLKTGSRILAVGQLFSAWVAFQGIKKQINLLLTIVTIY